MISAIHQDIETGTMSVDPLLMPESEHLIEDISEVDLTCHDVIIDALTS